MNCCLFKERLVLVRRLLFYSAWLGCCIVIVAI